MLESNFKTSLKRKLKNAFPGAIVCHLNPNDIQGIPDLIVLYGNKWAALEGKRNASASKRPNQETWVNYLNGMGFSSFIYPENENEVIEQLKLYFNNEEGGAEMAGTDVKQFNNHANLIGKHAPLSASQSAWLNKSPDELKIYLARTLAAPIGTALHDIARKHIKHKFPITEYSKEEVLLSLVEDYGIPGNAIDIAFDFDFMFNNFSRYTNECIANDMVPEVLLYYSDYCFGTVDAITNIDTFFSKKKSERVLFISDLKTGATKVHMEQLYIYAALFCLEYNVKPGETKFVCSIYQNDEVIMDYPDATIIAPVMDKLIAGDKIARGLKY